MRFTDGSAAKMKELPVDADFPGQRFRTNHAIATHDRDGAITNHTMVLYHYMSRSMTVRTPPPLLLLLLLAQCCKRDAADACASARGAVQNAR